MVNKKTEENQKEACPKCGSLLSEIITTKSGRRLQRCSAGKWNKETKKVEGCNYIKWLPFEPQVLEEKCPKCGAPLLLNITRFGKRMKKCSTNSWDAKTRTASGCDYVEWIKGTSEELEEKCPKCGSQLLMVTTASGKKLKKCSTNKWDSKNRVAVGCDYIEWL
ncbi:MAG: topoisomerase DNA-binding C4 zinc finger domain-containing protein [Microgenomates group bacterium]|nr:topoisomerase DNA-binding C4 zinc finger domain-containing protein [Microgenomates group bacterium]